MRLDQASNNKLEGPDVAEALPAAAAAAVLCCAAAKYCSKSYNHDLSSWFMITGMTKQARAPWRVGKAVVQGGREDLPRDGGQGLAILQSGV